MLFRSINSELPHEETLAALVATLQESYDEAENSYRRLLEDKNKIEAEIKTETKAYERGVKAFDKDQTVANADARAAEACSACGLENLADAVLSYLDALEASTTIRKDNLDGKIKDGEQKENSLKKLRKDLDAKRKSIQSLTEDMKKAEKAVSDCKAKIDTAKTLISTRKAETETAAQKVGELVVGEWDKLIGIFLHENLIDKIERVDWLQKLILTLLVKLTHKSLGSIEQHTLLERFSPQHLHLHNKLPVLYITTSHIYNTVLAYVSIRHKLRREILHALYLLVICQWQQSIEKTDEQVLMLTEYLLECKISFWVKISH